MRSLGNVSCDSRRASVGPQPKDALGAALIRAQRERDTQPATGIVDPVQRTRKLQWRAADFLAELKRTADDGHSPAKQGSFFR